MPRQRKIDRPHRIEVQLPQSVYNLLNAELHSDVEGRVPHGAYSKVFTQLVTDWLRTRGAVV